MVAGKQSRRPGEAKNSWLTGTAAWNYHAITEHILGIKPDFDGLLIDPCIPSDWSGYRVTRQFRGATYHVEVSNPDAVCKGVSNVTVDGEAVDGSRIPLAKAGSEVRVKVQLG
jgi:cellobiose phosphorylase